MIDLVKALQKKMKGFSLQETKDYYRSIVKRAWSQVDDAETPQVRSERYAENIEWTMLDGNFEERTRRTFRTGPVFVPAWWAAYRPSYGGGTPSAPTPAPAQRTTVSHGRGVSLPQIPGANFAASLVNGVQQTAGNLVSNLTSFTGGVTKTTNPPPAPSKAGGSSAGRSSGGSCACACACACAGCACACAGGGR
jgi:hypothetical protein